MRRSLATFSVWPLLFILLTFTTASGVERPKIIVGGDHDNPPYEFLENGKPTGFNIELIRAVSEVMGFDVEFRLGPWSKVREELEQGKIDALAGMYYSPQRGQLLDFSVPHTMVTSGIFVRKGSPIQSLEDIRGKEVIVQEGDVIHDYLRQRTLTPHIITVTDPANELRLLASGKHDCALMPSRLQGEYLVKKLNLSNIGFIKSDLPQLSYCFAVRKGNGELLHRLDEGLNILKLTGRYREINEKWFGVYEKRNLWETIKYYVLALALSLALVLGFLIWSGMLKRRVEQRTAELRENEEKFRVLAETSPAAICVYQGEYIVYLNATMIRLTGYTEQELMKMRFWEWMHEDFRESVRERGLARQRGETVSSHYEIKYLTKDGEEKWLFLSAGRIEYKGKPAGIVTMFDITDRKRMEDELRQAHDELEKRVEERTLALRNANELLQHEIYERKRTERVNMARLRLIQFAATHSLDELLEATLDEAEALTGSIIGFYVFLEADQKTLSLQNWSTRTKKDFCKAEGKGLHYDISAAGVWVDCIRERRPVIHNDYASLPNRKGLPPGHAPLVRELVVPVFRGGSIMAILAVGNKPGNYTPQDVETVSLLADLAWEIAVRKQAEEALKRAKEEWERTFASVPDLIAILDNRHRVQRVNEAMAKRLGLKPDECVGLHCYEAIHGLSESPPFCPHTQTLMDGRKHVVEVHEERLGGDFLVSTIPLNDERGVMIGSVHIAYDITERKRAEEALRESESRVRRKLESILDPEGDIGELDLSDILDAPGIQALMDDLYRNTGLKMSIIDLKGRVLVDVGWQDICLEFHRGHPETLKRCIESDTSMTEGITPGWFRRYHCKNNMWHLVTPIMVGGKHMGNLFMGQFFFDNEELDYGLFRAQARKYGFPEEEYMAALEAVPRHSEECVNKGKAFFLRLIDMFSKLSYGNIKLARSLAERDRLTETLRQANMVVENSPVVLLRCKAAPGWPVELVSKNVVQFGYTPEEFLSGELTYSSIVYPRDLGKLIAETEEYSATGKGKWLQEYRIVTKEGDIRWIIDETVCERNKAGEITHYEGVIIDVTERRKAEEQLILQQIQLREVNNTLEERVREEVTKNREKDIMLIQQNRQAALGEMFDHIAHQWKQPLNSIAVIIQALGSTCVYEQVTSEYIVETVDSIMDMVGHMAQTIDVFRNFYRPDKEKTVFLVKDSIDKALSFVTPLLWRHGIGVDLDADPELSAFGYPKEYAQVLLNLLGNAKDALIERRIKDPRINIKAIADGEYAVVTIADNAGGVPDTNIENIFDLYFTTKESSGGTGIGLYMSKNIIEKNMGGKLTVSNVDNGAQFRIELGKS